jgi:hypothetical protein
VVGVKSKGAFQVDGNSGVAFGATDGNLMVTNLDRVWKLVAEAPGQAEQWGVLLRAVSSDYAAMDQGGADPRSRFDTLASTSAPASHAQDLVPQTKQEKKAAAAAAKAAASAAKKLAKKGGPPRDFQPVAE